MSNDNTTQHTMERDKSLIETIPRYKKFALDVETLGQSVVAQTIAKIAPGRMNWPDEPWTPTSPLDKRLKELRDGL